MLLILIIGPLMSMRYRTQQSLPSTPEFNSPVRKYKYSELVSSDRLEQEDVEDYKITADGSSDNDDIIESIIERRLDNLDKLLSENDQSGEYEINYILYKIVEVN